MKQHGDTKLNLVLWSVDGIQFCNLCNSDSRYDDWLSQPVIKFLCDLRVHPSFMFACAYCCECVPMCMQRSEV